MSTKNEKIKEEIAKQEAYENEQKRIKSEIKSSPHYFWRLVWYYIKKPFKWIKDNIKDWRTAIIFGIVFLVVSCEVWVPYLLAIITWGTTFSATMLGVASTCWLFWLGPFTPFIPICIAITIAIKAVFNKIRYKHMLKKEKKNE